MCGGNCIADEDLDGLCDDVDDCVGEYDAVGVCNGACSADLDGDSVCDDSETLGCDDSLAINFDESATENDGSCNYEGLEVPEGFQFIPGPSSGTVLGTVTLNGVPGNGLDWIGAFTTQGLCAGASNLTVFEGQSYASLTIYGDDPTTPDVVEGIEAGGTFSLRLFDQSEDLIVSYNGGQQFSGWINTNGGALPDSATLKLFMPSSPPRALTQTEMAFATTRTIVPTKPRTPLACVAGGPTTSTTTGCATTRKCLGAPTRLPRITTSSHHRRWNL